MGKFGWSYPPGCDGVPDDEFPCEDDSWENDVANLNRDDLMAGWEFWCPECGEHRDICRCHDYIEREDAD